MSDYEFKLQDAMLWESVSGNKVRCKLCPFGCLIDEGRTGRCQVRKNIKGRLYSLNYHYLCAANVDAIEKKPLFHFQPGSLSYSIACPGCNFQCSFCQNWQISQMMREEKTLYGKSIPPEVIVDQAVRTGCSSIAYTYTEPTVFFELAYDTSRLAHERGLKNVFVSNGFISIEALETIRPYLDGINVDLKSFRETFYQRICKARLGPVLDSLRWLSSNGVWLEITTLLVPNQNDSDEELRDIAEFIVKELSVDVPWHISRYHPDYRYSASPPTPISSIKRAIEIGKSAGLRYVYGGNIPGDPSENTYCWKCGSLLIGRYGFTILENNITSDNACPDCGARIAGVELSFSSGRGGKKERII